MSTLRKVAQKAEVSISTVSRVINNPDMVQADTREKVQKVMKSLSYQPNRVAQRLRFSKGNSKLLGLIIPDIQNQFYSKVVRGIEDAAYKKNYALILCNSDEDPDKELFYMRILESESVDGMILLPSEPRSERFRQESKSNIPIVCVDRKFIEETGDNVVTNNVKGAKLAVSHLAKLNHKRIAIITSSLDFSSFREREEGYRRVLIDHNLEIQSKLIKKVDPRSAEEANKATLELFELPAPPTALFITNNLMTLGALEAIHELGLQIPEDVSLIMFDDLPWSASINPPLTVIRQPSYEMGKKAAELFFRRISNLDDDIVEIKMDPTIIIRRSTGKPKEK
jgi:LacI family transcriptional regulator/LacI family repressor for deo operon, udp, cdd, tsx, nupC, and nupG